MTSTRPTRRRITAVVATAALLLIGWVWPDGGSGAATRGAPPVAEDAQARCAVVGDPVRRSPGSRVRCVVSPREVTVTSVEPGTRVILAGGEPLTVRGFNYFPEQVGDSFLANAPDPVTCANDAELMRAAGTTVVRIWLYPVSLQAGRPPAISDACLDAFAERGIGVAWTVYQPSGDPRDPDFAARYELALRQAVASFGDHPATLFWLIGNEVRLQPCGGERACWEAFFGRAGDPGGVGVLNDLIRLVRSLDPDHLVGTTVATGCSAPSLTGSNVPDLQVWGVNKYPDGGSFDTSCLDLSDLDVDPRPKVITETGTDRYHCGGESGLYEGLLLDNVNPNSSWVCLEDRSGEDQAAQAAYVGANWDSLAPRLATPDDPNGSVSGALYFMWSDLWALCGGFPCPGTQATHEFLGSEGRHAPDGNWNFEWFGVTHAQTRGQDSPRVTSLAYDALATRWTTEPPLAFDTDPVVDVTGCPAVEVRWATTAPATTEVQMGIVDEVTAPGASTRVLVADNTLYHPVVTDEAMRSEHRATVTVPSGVPSRVVPRSFAADGRSVTSAPIEVTC